MGKRLEMHIEFLTAWVMDTPVAGDRASKFLELRFFMIASFARMRS